MSSSLDTIGKEISEQPSFKAANLCYGSDFTIVTANYRLDAAPPDCLVRVKKPIVAYKITLYDDNWKCAKAKWLKYREIDNVCATMGEARAMKKELLSGMAVITEIIIPTGILVYIARDCYKLRAEAAIVVDHEFLIPRDTKPRKTFPLHLFTHPFLHRNLNLSPRDYYITGQTFFPNSFSMKFEPCAEGVHFVLRKQEAADYIDKHF